MEASDEEVVTGASEVGHSGAGRAVLVIDDEPSVRALVVEALAEMGCAAIEASDGPSGLRALSAAPQVELLVTDVGLPGGLNGVKSPTRPARHARI